MAIYTRAGTKVKIVAGDADVIYVERIDDNEIFESRLAYIFADGGINEILTALDGAETNVPR